MYQVNYLALLQNNRRTNLKCGLTAHHFSRMKKRNKLIQISLIFTALSGCAARDNFENLTWRPFKDIDGSIQEVGFYSWKVLDSNNGKSTERDAYMAYLAQPFGKLKAKKELGEMYPLGRANEDSATATIFLLNGKSVNIYDEQNIKALGQANNFDFYEFGGMRLSHAKFSAKKAICQDFKGKTGVELLMTTNYYPENSFTDFYTALIDVKLRHSVAPTEIGYTPSFTGHNEKLQKEIKAQEQKLGKNIVINNIKEKASILFNIICK